MSIQYVKGIPQYALTPDGTKQFIVNPDLFDLFGDVYNNKTVIKSFTTLRQAS